jgi:ABC-type nitrate/sulfonate/bicarbonate transport system substrate-binding protein
MDPDSDVTWVALGQAPSQIAAFKSKQIDAVVAFEPIQTLLVDSQKIGKYLLDFRKGEGNPLFKNWSGQSFVISKSVADKSPEKFRRYLAAIKDAYSFIGNPANKYKLIDIFSKQVQLSKPEITALIENNVPMNFRPQFSCDAIMNVANWLVSSGQLPKDQEIKDCKDYVWSDSVELGFLQK